MTEPAVRAVRTLLQGAAATALVAIVSVAHDQLSSGSTDYRAIAIAAGTSGLAAVASYLHRWLDERRTSVLAK